VALADFGEELGAGGGVVEAGGGDDGRQRPSVSVTMCR
jgi:hypothetical protein